MEAQPSTSQVAPPAPPSDAYVADLQARLQEALDEQERHKALQDSLLQSQPPALATPSEADEIRALLHQEKQERLAVEKMAIEERTKHLQERLRADKQAQELHFTP